MRPVAKVVRPAPSWANALNFVTEPGPDWHDAMRHGTVAVDMRDCDVHHQHRKDMVPRHPFPHRQPGLERRVPARFRTGCLADQCTQVQVALQRGAEPHRRTKGADRGKVIRNPQAFGRSPSPEKAQGSCFLEAFASCRALEQAAAIAVSCRNAWKLRPGYRQTRMGKWAAALLLATLIAGLFGFGGTGGPATAIAQTAFFVLLVPSVLSLMLTAMTLD